MRNKLLFTFCLMCGTAAVVAQAGGYIAGLQPDRRPDQTPQLVESPRTPEQVEHALRGIEKPVPGNVELIASTGNWWVPLRQPGMAGPYDLRGWHSAATTGVQSTTTASTH